MVRHHPNPEQAQHFNSVLLYMSWFDIQVY
jgi:hypothetical protein